MDPIAGNLCRQMLAYAGKGRFVIEPLDLNHVIRDISRLMATTVNKKAVLEHRLKDGLPAIMGDASRLTQIFMNLVANASDAIGDETGGDHGHDGVQALLS